MCGIFLLLNNCLEPGRYVFSKDFVHDKFMNGVKRGPEMSKLIHPVNQLTAGFHRLAINGLDEESMQPLWLNNKMLICNGEIYNYQELYKQMNITPNTKSDCEVILHLYCRYGIEQTLRMLDGVFAFALYDADEKKVFIARDPYGVRPLYTWRGPNNIFLFASELKMVSGFHNQTVWEDVQNIAVSAFSPGHYQVIHLHHYFGSWMRNETFRYHNISTISCYVKPVSMFENITYYLKMAVIKRCITTDRPIACLLSGGLDSSLITALVNEYYVMNHPGRQLETYSIGLAESEDLKYARIVANHLNTRHTEIIITEDDFFHAIPEVIRAIESYDTTTVRASIGNYLVGKYISEHSLAKVIFNGDGSDELCGGYLYMHNAPDAIEFDKETKRLLNDIHAFDVLRSDKCISSHGLEPRTPFLDKTFVEYYLSLQATLRYHPGNNECEKYLLRSAFANMYHPEVDKPFLPDEILWRTKEAFSDGVSGQGRSLYTILQQKIATINRIDEVYAEEYETKYKNSHLPPKTLEQYYYRSIFEKYYPNSEKLVPYFWMPKYTTSIDPSARTLTTLYNAKLNHI
jgi:asparagine synthase (glutamine-hydrolysing)